MSAVSICAVPFLHAATPDSTAPSEQPSTVKTVFGDAPFTSGGFGAPVLKVGSVNGQMGLIVGGRGGWVVNKTFVLGGGGYGLVTHNDVTGLPKTNLQLGYGGAELEWIVASDEAVHASAMLLIGAGGAQIRSDSAWESGQNYRMGDIASTTFFVLEPQVNVELNLTRWFRVGAGASYRWTNGASMTPGTAVVNDVSLRGVTGVLTLKFGVY